MKIYVTCMALLCVVLSGCVNTRAAYREAQTPDEYAYVLAEHYASLVKEAADLKERESTPREAVSVMQRAELTARPVVMKLRPLRDAYLATKNAQTEAELQEAINQSVLLIGELIRSVRAAAGDPNPSTSWLMPAPQTAERVELEAA